ncbi:MAG: hypothetical protein ACHP7N_10695, partial [Caulobacterales bacterium]
MTIQVRLSVCLAAILALALAAWAPNVRAMTPSDAQNLFETKPPPPSVNPYRFPTAPTDPAALKKWRHLMGHLDYLYEVDMTDVTEHGTDCLTDEYWEGDEVLDDLETAIAQAK